MSSGPDTAPWPGTIVVAGSASAPRARRSRPPASPSAGTGARRGTAGRRRTAETVRDPDDRVVGGVGRGPDVPHPAGQVVNVDPGFLPSPEALATMPHRYTADRARAVSARDYEQPQPLASAEEAGMLVIRGRTDDVGHGQNIGPGPAGRSGFASFGRRLAGVRIEGSLRAGCGGGAFSRHARNRAAHRLPDRLIERDDRAERRLCRAGRAPLELGPELTELRGERRQNHAYSCEVGGCLPYAVHGHAEHRAQCAHRAA